MTIKLTREEAIQDLKAIKSFERYARGRLALDIAIEALKRERPDEWCTDCKEYDTEKNCCPRFNRVIRGAVADALEAVPSTDRPRGEWIDCIDRQELIGSIQYLFDGLADSWVEASEKIIEIIREEPTVPRKEYTEQQIRDTFNSGFSCGIEREWIDTEEEMPIDSQEVIVSVYWTDYGDTILAYGHYNARFDTWKLYSDLEGELIKGYEVVAWMPMPYPYTEDRKAE